MTKRKLLKMLEKYDDNERIYVYVRHEGYVDSTNVRHVSLFENEFGELEEHCGEKNKGVFKGLWLY